MATLVSSGVSISVSTNRFTHLLVLVQFQSSLLFQDKSSPDGSGTAAFTSKANAGKLQLITSQRELLQQFAILFYKS